MSQTRQEESSDNAAHDTDCLVLKQIWHEVIFPALERKALYSFASVSKESRQLVFCYLFNQPEFSTGINKEIATLAHQSKHRFGYLSTPGPELSMRATIGGNPTAVALRVAETTSAVLTFSLMRLVICQDNPSQVGISVQLGLIGAGILATTAFDVAFKNTNMTDIRYDESEALHQQHLHRKLYGLSYLRDELPGLTFERHRLFAKPHDSNKVSPIIVDKSNKYYVETFFSKWKGHYHSLKADYDAYYQYK